jgi:hypothetical protein
MDAVGVRSRIACPIININFSCITYRAFVVLYAHLSAHEGGDQCPVVRRRAGLLEDAHAGSPSPVAIFIYRNLKTTEGTGI